MQYVRRGILIFFGITLSGCQSIVASERIINTTPAKSKSATSKPVTNTIAKQATKIPRKPTVQTPVYIDLGPIETVALPAGPTKQSTVVNLSNPAIRQSTAKFGRDISPSAAVTAEQLRPSLSRASDLLVEQPSGTLSDRCDPSYWGGQVPPAGHGCHTDIQNVHYGKNASVLLPGTYIRLDPKSELQLEDAALVARKVGMLDTSFSDDTLGAVLLVRTGQQSQPKLMSANNKASGNDPLGVAVNIAPVLPSVLVPGS